MAKEENTKSRTRKSSASGSSENLNTFLTQGKIPPQAIDVEEVVLGALLIEPGAVTEVIEFLHPEMFYKTAHQYIYKAIKDLFGDNQNVDLITVANKLTSEGQLEFSGGPFYLAKLTNKVASSANIEYHARIIIQKYIQRQLISISSDLIEEAFNETKDTFDLLDEAESKLFDISEKYLKGSYTDIPTLIHSALKRIEDAHKNSGSLLGIPSGFTEVDRITSGWQKTDLIIIAARPSMGKTAFVLSMARTIAVDHNIPIAFFSLEMGAIQLVTRLISSEVEINSDKLRKGNLDNDEWKILNERIQPLSNSKLIIDDTPALSIFQLRAKARRLKQQHDIQMIVIDYLQLMTLGDSNVKSGNREQEISTISRSLKALAKDLDIPVICLSQLNRSVETRGGDKRPMLSDLRESGAIEQDADIVAFLYRPEYYKIHQDEQGESTAGKASVIISKHRNGATGEVQLRFINDFAKFTDLDETFIGDDPFGGINSPDSYTMPSKMNDDFE